MNLYHGTARNGIIHRPDPAWLHATVYAAVLIAMIAAGN